MTFWNGFLEIEIFLMFLKIPFCFLELDIFSNREADFKRLSRQNRFKNIYWFSDKN